MISVFVIFHRKLGDVMKNKWKPLSASIKLLGTGRIIFHRGHDILSRKMEWIKIRNHRYKTTEISLDDLLLRQSKAGELLRCDIIVRLLAIENYYGKNDFGLELYRKMQDARVGDGYGKKAEQKFRKLIQSYETNGYIKSSGIILDRNFNLIDGSHRIAMAIFHGIPYITAYIVNSNHPVEYSIDWFIMHGFSTEEIEHIIERCKEVLLNLNNKFLCIIWSPAQEFADEILKDLSLYGTMETIEEYAYSTGEYENIVRAIYATDDIERWKIEKKLVYMQGFTPRITCVVLAFADPDFRIKSTTGLLLSKRAERIKKVIRAKYRARIPDYFFDIILHIGDNVYQSSYMRKLFAPDFSFREIVKILNKFLYAFTKIDVPYMPRAFPDVIPVGKDADILCNEQEFELLVSEIKGTLRKYRNYNIVEIREKNGTKIRIQHGNTLYFQIDILYKIDQLQEDFVSDALSNRLHNDRDIYIISPEFEYIYRAYSYHENNRKTYHKKYLEEHPDDKNLELFRKYCRFPL